MAASQQETTRMSRSRSSHWSVLIAGLFAGIMAIAAVTLPVDADDEPLIATEVEEEEATVVVEGDDGPDTAVAAEDDSATDAGWTTRPAVVQETENGTVYLRPTDAAFEDPDQRLSLTLKYYFPLQQPPSWPPGPSVSADNSTAEGPAQAGPEQGPSEQSADDEPTDEDRVATATARKSQPPQSLVRGLLARLRQTDPAVSVEPGTPGIELKWLDYRNRLRPKHVVMLIAGHQDSSVANDAKNGQPDRASAGENAPTDSAPAAASDSASAPTPNGTSTGGTTSAASSDAASDTGADATADTASQTASDSAPRLASLRVLRVGRFTGNGPWRVLRQVAHTEFDAAELPPRWRPGGLLDTWDRPADAAGKRMFWGRVIAVLKRPDHRYAVDFYGESLHEDGHCRVWLTGESHRWGRPVAIQFIDLPIARPDGTSRNVSVLAILYEDHAGRTRSIAIDFPLCRTPMLEQMQRLASSLGNRKADDGGTGLNAAKLLGEDLLEELARRLVDGRYH